MASIVLAPKAAAEAVAHEEQLRIWADDVIGALALEGNFLRDDLTYDDKVDLERVIMRELKNVIEAAFDHPEARTIKKVG